MAKASGSHSAQPASKSDAHISISALQAILESSTDAICAFDTDRRLIAFNAAFAQIMRAQYGVELREGSVVSDIVSPVDRDFFFELGTRVFEGESLIVERIFEDPSGAKVYYDFRVRPLIAEGATVGGAVFARDVTEQRQNERELQMLFAESPLPMWVVDVETLHFIRVNKAACEHYGYSEEEFRKMTPMDLRTPEDAAQFKKDILPLIRTVKDLAFQITRHKKKNGELIWVEIRSHIIQQDGRLLRLVHIFDITEKMVAEQALKEANNRFELASEATLSSIFEIDLTTGRTIRSKGLKALLGFEPEESQQTQEWWESRVHPDDLAEAKSHLVKGIADGSSVETEYRVRHSDGHYITVWDRAIIIRDAAGKPVRVFGATQDISERIRVKRELQRSNERFQLATQAVTSMIYELDLATGISQRSASMATLSGFTVEEIPNHVDWWYTRVHPDDAERLRATIDRAIRGSSDLYECEYRFRHKAGHYITIWDRGIISRDKSGRAIKIIGNTQDITRRRNIEHELERANERFRLAAEAINSTIYDWDLTTNYCYYSSGLEQLLGFSDATDPEVHKEGWYMSRVHSDDVPQLESVFRSARIEGHQYQLEYRMCHRDGHYIYVLDRGIVMRDEEGHAVRIVGSIEDITAKKLTEAELIEQRNRALTAKESADEMNRLKSAFVANMSHEIRTPLTAIIGFAEVLQEQLKDSPNGRFADIIETNSKRLFQTLNSVLDLARIESTRIALDEKVVDVNTEIEHIVSQLEPLASNRNLHLRFQASKVALQASVDVRYLTQIVMNLVSNAIKFTEYGHVRVIVQAPSEPLTAIPEPAGAYRYYSASVPDTDHFRIIVEDTGVGISRENIAFIFDEFRQSSQGYNRNVEGSGLGLTISNKLAQAMGGAIEVRSAQGVGSLFILRLPANIVQPATETKENVAAAPSEPLINHRPTILLVEDIISMAELTQAMIGQRATVLHAASTTEARSILENVTPDLILMDINLGEEMTGLDFTRELKAKGLGQYARIVALTAYAMPKDKQMALDAGCDDYLAKPFSKSALLEMVERNLAERAKLLSAAKA